eukprot:2852771-Alexandrium_andersonii.AAC.1
MSLFSRCVKSNWQQRMSDIHTNQGSVAGWLSPPCEPMRDHGWQQEPAKQLVSGRVALIIPDSAGNDPESPAHAPDIARNLAAGSSAMTRASSDPKSRARRQAERNR